MKNASLLFALIFYFSFFANAQKEAIPTSSISMVNAASAFLKSLSPELKKAASFPFEYKNREQWHFVPLDNRKGARIGLMNDIQQDLGFGLVKTGLSEKGYQIAKEIMNLEEILVIKENQKQGSDYRNSTKYFLSIFGTPSDKTPWGWKYEGHHLSLNYTSVGNQLSVTPAFWGSNPAEVDIEHPNKGKRVLGEMEDAGRSFMHSLTAKQQQKALISNTAYPEILTGADSHANLDKFEGLAYSEMTVNQQQKFVALIQLYTNIMNPNVADAQWVKIKNKGLNKLFFTWAGSLKPKEKHYYRIHGPITIIEYDNVQGNGNHAHIVWRDTENDFGRDLLKEHHLNHKH